MIKDVVLPWQKTDTSLLSKHPTNIQAGTAHLKIYLRKTTTHFITTKTFITTRNGPAVSVSLCRNSLECLSIIKTQGRMVEWEGHQHQLSLVNMFGLQPSAPMCSGTYVKATLIPLAPSVRCGWGACLFETQLWFDCVQSSGASQTQQS